MIDNQEADTLYLVMELMEGGCIQGSELEQGPVGEFLAHSYFMYVFFFFVYYCYYLLLISYSFLFLFLFINN